MFWFIALWPIAIPLAVLALMAAPYVIGRAIAFVLAGLLAGFNDQAGD